MQVMSALAQPTRLDVYRLLVAALPAGMGSGEIAVAAGTSPTSMSAHLAVLSRAGLVTSVKEGRAVIYRAAMQPIANLRSFLKTSVERA